MNKERRWEMQKGKLKEGGCKRERNGETKAKEGKIKKKVGGGSEERKSERQKENYEGEGRAR